MDKIAVKEKIAVFDKTEIDFSEKRENSQKKTNFFLERLKKVFTRFANIGIIPHAWSGGLRLSSGK